MGFLHSFHHWIGLQCQAQDHIIAIPGKFVIIAGDSSYKHQQLLDNKFGGSNIDFVQSQRTYDNILMYAEKYPLIYLPSHDENSANRLTRKEYLVNKK